jgi:two-component system sensor kinase FixL
MGRAMSAVSDAVFSHPAAVAQALAAGNLGLWRWCPSRDHVHLSDVSMAILQSSNEMISYQAFLGLLSPPDPETADRILQDCVNTGKEFDFEVQLRHGGHWLRVRGRGCIGSNILPYATGILIDTGRHIAIEQLNNQIAAVMVSSGDATVTKSLDGFITGWNHSAEVTLGYREDEIVGRHCSVLMAPGHEHETEDLLETLKHGQRLDHYETRLRRKDQTIIDVSLTVSPILDGYGRLTGAATVARDITTAKRDRAALQEREAHLRSVLDTVPDAMVVIDQHGRVQSFSATAEQLFGYQATEVIGRAFNVLMPSHYRDHHDRYLSQFVATGEREPIGSSRMIVGLRKDDSTFPMELAFGEMILGERRLFTGFIRDLTERQQTQRRMQDLQAELIHMSRFTAMGEMASTLAHELNQPLTAVASYLNGCRRLLDGAEGAHWLMLRDAIDRAADQALRAGQIIRRLRQFVARGESERHVENLSKLIEEASALALVGVREAGVHVSFAFDPRASFVLVDKIQIQQVMLNLMRNAIEAMQETTVRELTIATAECAEGMIEVRVIDTGPGIAPEIASQLFQPFVTTKPQGMGVGLSISRTIVEAHGGRLWAEPNRGGGVVFSMTLRALSGEDLPDGD